MVSLALISRRPPEPGRLSAIAAHPDEGAVSRCSGCPGISHSHTFEGSSLVHFCWGMIGGNGTAQFAYQSPDLVKVLNAARKGNFKVRIPAKNGAVPPEVAAGLNQVFAVNQRMAQELEELRRERKDLLRALEAFEEG